MGVDKNYIHPEIYLCDKCNGKGTVIKHHKLDILHQDGTIEVCPDCEGSGRVVISTEIIITTKPFK